MSIDMPPLPHIFLVLGVDIDGDPIGDLAQTMNDAISMRTDRQECAYDKVRIYKVDTATLATEDVTP